MRPTVKFRLLRLAVRLASMFISAVSPALACDPPTEYVKFTIPGLELSLPKELVMYTDLKGAKGGAFIVALDVPLDCLGLKLLGPYNSPEYREYMIVVFQVHDEDELHRLPKLRSDFGAKIGSSDGYDIYKGLTGRNLWVATQPDRPLIVYCDSGPVDITADTPRPCEVEDELARYSDDASKTFILASISSMLAKDLDHIVDVDSKIRAFLTRMVVVKRQPSK